MSEHWYDRQGKTAYQIDGKNTTLREARKYGLVPSVTGVLGVIAKPALVTWMVNQGIMAALTGTRLENEPDEAYIARVQADSKRQAIDAANEGSRIHDACETFLRDGRCSQEYILHAQAAKQELKQLFPNVDDWVCEKSFSSPLGFGGKCDLHSPSTGIVVDYKTKDGDFSDGKKLAWDQHWQLAAYNKGLGLQVAPCAAIFLSRTHPGAVSSYVWEEAEIMEGWEMFEAALTLWKKLKKYDGSFKET